MTGFLFVLERLLQLALVLALPIAVGELGWAVLRSIAPSDFWRVPAVVAPSKCLGVILGIILITSRYDSRLFDLHLLFVSESPWNLSLSGFLAERVNPLNYGIGSIVQRLATEGSHGLLVFGLVAAAVLFIAIAAGPFFFWPAPIAAMAGLTGLLLSAVAAYLTIYLVCLALWTVHLLNFWSIALLIVLFQYYRQRT
ncbi:MAG: hypothetical protein HYR63_01720 [Proteobacteria bacterium]|nr:hypothetical protein [Pseudomonadota bacterium]